MIGAALHVQVKEVQRGETLGVGELVHDFPRDILRIKQHQARSSRTAKQFNVIWVKYIKCYTLDKYKVQFFQK